MKYKELYNICHDEAVAYANSEQWSKRTGEEKSFLIQGYLDAMMEARKSEITEKKKEYPKTYEECCKVLDVCSGETLQYGDLTLLNDYEFNIYVLLENFRKLRICRDAYWKIAGEEMGLGKPWEPDWTVNNAKYSIYTIKGVLTKATSCYDGAIFVFPTEEMRDAFYESFKKEIEICK